MVSATIASGCTLYMMHVYPHCMECNSVAAACFRLLGPVPSMALGILALLPLMVAIPFIFRQNEKLGLIPVLIMGCIVAYTAFDAVNDVSAILGYRQAYLVAHAVLSSTNNVTGSVVGTGRSLC